MHLENAATLVEALGLRSHRVVAFTGGGGKTSAMFCLARELAAERILVTTTTRIWVPRPDQAGLVVADDLDAACQRLASGWDHGIRALGTAVTPEGKLQGISPEWVARLAQVADRVLVEADGAAGQPITAPRQYEPVIPTGTTLLVPVVGLDAVGAPLDAAHVHRVAEIAALTGLAEGALLSPEAIARVMLGPGGNVKDAPPGVEIVPLVNKIDTFADEAAARALAAALIACGARRVVLARLIDLAPVVAIVEAHESGAC
jgi:molybdenum cofactor cytidylyltransferase